jgi:hypothetical protein
MESMEEGIIVGSSQTPSCHKESSAVSTSVSLDHTTMGKKYKIIFVLFLMIALFSIAAFFFVRSIGKRQIITAKVWIVDGDDAGN